MKRELYLSGRELRELQAAIWERATPPGEKRPRCEWCGWQHGKLKRTKKGYLVPRWLHKAHIKGRPLLSKDPDDYMALCERCHMAYDRQPDDAGVTSRYREGYAITTTDTLIEKLAAVGVDVWGVVGEGWYWRIHGQRRIEEGGPEDSPADAVAMVVARLMRLETTAMQFVAIGMLIGPDGRSI